MNNLKAIQEIDFTGNLERNRNIAKTLILEEVIETNFKNSWSIS